MSNADRHTLGHTPNTENDNVSLVSSLLLPIYSLVLGILMPGHGTRIRKDALSNPYLNLGICKEKLLSSQYEHSRLGHTWKDTLLIMQLV